MQEIKIKPGYNHLFLSLPGFKFESEFNTYKTRVGSYIKSVILELAILKV
jgi:hypothetical protein